MISLTAIPVDELATVLKRSGARHASVEAIQRDLDAGAPRNPDGTINLLAYTAWLIRERGNGN